LLKRNQHRLTVIGDRAVILCVRAFERGIAAAAVE